MPAVLPGLADLTYRVPASRFVADHANFFPTLYLHDLAVVHDHFDRTVVDARNGPEYLLLDFRGQPSVGLPVLNTLCFELSHVRFAFFIYLT